MTLLSGIITQNDMVIILVSMAVMLIFSRFAAELGRMVRLPVVMGELVIGIVLGPSVLGYIYPDTAAYLYPLQGNAFIALEGITKVAVIMLLFVAGMEVQLPLVLKQGRAAVSTSTLSMIIPFLCGFLVAWYKPAWFDQPGTDHLLFALFFGTALSISALPVIARILLDMGIFKTRIGTIIIASAMFNDLLGWLIFSFILATFQQHNDISAFWVTIVTIILFGFGMLTIGRKALDKIMPWMQSKLSWPGGVLSISLGICFISAAFTELLGIHAILGAFIAGIAVGDSVHLKEQARDIIHQFVTNIFAPLFFVSIGLKVNFIDNFDFSLVALIVVFAFFGKVCGAYAGARLGGFTGNESLVIGFGMNARGAMEIILGSIALQSGLIGLKVFVALVIMALITSLTSSPFMKYFLERPGS